MILDETIETTISNQGKYYKALGYVVPLQGRSLTIRVSDLAPNSNKKVRAKCDDCGYVFIRSYQCLQSSKINPEGKHRCNPCTRKLIGLRANHIPSGLAASKRIGVLHPRYKSDKKAWHEYRRLVSYYTRKSDITQISDSDKPRKRCGIEGAHHLDHKLSIFSGFNQGIDPKYIGHICNLRMIPWLENASKHDSNYFNLDELNEFIVFYEEMKATL